MRSPPSNWQEVPLKDIQAKKKWALNGGPFGSKLVRRHYVARGVPVIRGTNLSGAGRFNLNGFVYVSEKKANQLLPNNAHPGDVIFTQRGTLGQVGIIPQNSPYPRYVISQSQMKLTVDQSKANPVFVYYYFRTDKTIKELESRAMSSGVPHINLAILRDFRILLPPLPVQRRIGSILSAYDDLIENNSRRIRLLEEMARLVYHEWFVRFRFPGHERVRMVESELGRIPEGWRVTTLGDVTEVNARSIQKGQVPETIRYINISSVSRGEIRTIDEIPFCDAPGRARRLVRHGDTIWSMVRPNLKAYGLIIEPTADLVVSTGFAVLSPIQIPFSFLYCVTTTEEFIGYLVNHTRGAAYPAVTAEDFRTAKIILPTAELLSRFHEFSSDIFTLIHRLREKNVVLRRTRDLLLPRLVSGEVDVSSFAVGVPVEA